MIKTLVSLDHLRLVAEWAADKISKVAARSVTAIEELDEKKQDKLTGVAGEVVGFNADGEPVAQSADSLASGKQSKPLTGSVTIPITGWGSDSTADYPKYYDIAVTGVTASDRASVDIGSASLVAAVACGMFQTCETLAGKIRLRAAGVPAAALTANYWIEKGA